MYEYFEDVSGSIWRDGVWEPNILSKLLSYIN